MVITLDKHKKPLGFTTEKRARQMLESKRACLHRCYPPVIIIKDIDRRNIADLQTYRIKIDPGAVHTGIAIVCSETNMVMFYAQIEHRGTSVHFNLLTRSMIRRNRRSRETEYRRPKFKKKGVYKSPRPAGWLPPSVKSVGDNIINIVKKLKKYINITNCSFEAVRFDSQLMDNPDIEGIEYQQGTLFGYELKEYLMQKYRHTCQYCGGESGDKILEWEHKIPRSRGGSDSIKNATLACNKCNDDKDNLTPEEWLVKLKTNENPSALDEKRIKIIETLVEDSDYITGSNRYSAWVTSSRRYVEKALFGIFDNVECSSGGKTKYNREKILGLPKDHHYDALCIGTIPKNGYSDRTNGYCLYIKAMGRGTRFRGKINKCGIICQKLAPRAKRIFGFMNGDIVSCNKPSGKGAGHHTGRVMTRYSGYFDIRTTHSDLVTVNYKHCKILQFCDGYQYLLKCAIPPGN